MLVHALRTVERVRERLVQQGLEAALNRGGLNSVEIELSILSRQ
jgi:hypothetical protein